MNIAITTVTNNSQKSGADSIHFVISEINSDSLFSPFFGNTLLNTKPKIITV